MPTRTELIWDGKYDAAGKRVAPLRVALPFQTVETVNESAQERQRGLFQRLEQEQPWRNRLIWGDKKYVLPSLLPEFAGKVNLIYIDPPFDTGADFSFTATVHDANPDDDVDDSVAFTKQPSLIEQKAYRDTWGRGIDSYLQWFYETVVLLHELLAENGSIYVELGWHVGHLGKIVLDEVFGQQDFRNEIIWKRTFAHNDLAQWGRVHDVILLYTKGEQYTWNLVTQNYDQSYLATKYRHQDERGRYRLVVLTAPGLRKGDSGKPWRGINPEAKGRHWSVPRQYVKQLLKDSDDEKLTIQQQLDLLDANGFIYWPKKADGIPEFKQYLGAGVPIQDIITDISPVNSQANERLDYPTQKPEALLDRILRASSNEGDLVLDCFAGSGTTAAAAEKLGRRWIACDLGRFAIHTTRKRLLQIPEVRPFVVQNLGKYERQLWLEDRSLALAAGTGGSLARAGDGDGAERHRAYVAFILQLYHATPLHGYTWLHGTRGGRLVHVGSVEAPVSVGDVKNLAAEFKKAIGTGPNAPKTNGIDVLGWDFAFELHEVAAQQAAAANIRMTFKRIPRDVMDKRAVEQGDIHFFELAALGVEAKVKGKDCTLTLTDFVIPPDDVPEEVRTAVKHWSQWIDYWAVDWDHKGDTFHNQWQTFRTRKGGKLALTAEHRYEEPGEYRAVVKVIDILGNDTTKTVKVKIK